MSSQSNHSCQWIPSTQQHRVSQKSASLLRRNRILNRYFVTTKFIGVCVFLSLLPLHVYTSFNHIPCSYTDCCINTITKSQKWKKSRSYHIFLEEIMCVRAFFGCIFYTSCVLFFLFSHEAPQRWILMSYEFYVVFFCHWFFPRWGWNRLSLNCKLEKLNEMRLHDEEVISSLRPLHWAKKQLYVAV